MGLSSDQRRHATDRVQFHSSTDVRIRRGVVQICRLPTCSSILRKSRADQVRLQGHIWRYARVDEMRTALIEY